MPFDFKDRVPSKLGRVKITPENGGAAYYAIVERADEPSVVGTPLSAANLNTAQETLVYTTTASASTYRAVYVSPSGKDTNAGTSSAPMATIKGAIRKYAKWHKTMDIYLQDGVYTENLGQIATGQCSLSIRGASEDRDKVTLNISTMIETHTAQFRLLNLTLNLTASGVRMISTYIGQLYANQVRFNMPENSDTSCINGYYGACIFLSDCIINAGKAAAVYGNEALLIRAINCTSERKIAEAFYANNGSLIEYSPTMNATLMTRETTGGRCIDVSAKPGMISGSLGSQQGRYLTYDGLLLQWDSVSIVPVDSTPTSANITFPIKYAETPLLFASVVTTVPENCSVAVRSSGVTDPKAQGTIILTRKGTTTTVINWLAIGKGSI